MFDFIKKIKREKEEKEKENSKHRLTKAKSLFTVKKRFAGEFDSLLENFRDNSLIMLITGRRGGGKTALGMKFVELGNILKKKIYVVGFENSKTPGWVKKAENLDEVPNGSLVLVDEAGISFSARSAMKKENKKMGDLLSIARHKNLSLIFITQSCMPKDTEIITNKGIEKLGKLKTGDYILSYNPKNKKMEFKKIFVSPVVKREVIFVETVDGDNIECSPDHKFIVKKGNSIVKKKAKDLTSRDYLLKPLKK